MFSRLLPSNPGSFLSPANHSCDMFCTNPYTAHDFIFRFTVVFNQPSLRGGKFFTRTPSSSI